eukprot:11197348-Lingulodinium_polyedra.AAC.1
MPQLRQITVGLALLTALRTKSGRCCRVASCGGRSRRSLTGRRDNGFQDDAGDSLRFCFRLGPSCATGAPCATETRVWAGGGVGMALGFGLGVGLGLGMALHAGWAWDWAWDWGRGCNTSTE